MTAIAWTLVGLMAGTLGVLSAALYSGLARLDAFGATLDGRIDTLGAGLRGEIHGLREQVHALDVRLTQAAG